MEWHRGNRAKLSGNGARKEVSGFATRHPENGHPAKIGSTFLSSKRPLFA
jgi:hypothetical protein